MMTIYRFRLLRPLTLLLAWVLLSGSSAFISCSTGDSDGGDDEPFNYAPRAENSYLVTTVNTPVSGFLQAEDSNGDNLTFRILEGPSLGLIDYFDPDSGRFTYFSNSTGVGRFSFVAYDGWVVSNVATVTITVNRYSAALQPATEAAALSQALPWAEVQTEALTVDPVNIDHWLKYAPAQGVLHSWDAGATWVLTVLDPVLLQGGTEAVIVGNGFVSGLLYLASNRTGGGYRLLRSVDGGQHWLLLGFDPTARLDALTSGPMRVDGGVMVYARLNGQRWQFLDYP